VSNGTGTVANASVSNIDVTCVTTAHAINVAVSGLLEGQTLDAKLNDGDAIAVVGAPDANGITTSKLGEVAPGNNYAVTLASPWATPAGWSVPAAGANPTSAEDISSLAHCTVKNASGTANAEITVNVSCAASAPTIRLLSNNNVATQNGVIYGAWQLQDPIALTSSDGNVSVYYRVVDLGNTAPLQLDMNTVQKLFNGRVDPLMNVSGDPPIVASGYASNVTTLKTDAGGTVTVALPTSDQLTNIMQKALSLAYPTNWPSGSYWSSTYYVPNSSHVTVATSSIGFSQPETNTHYITFQLQ
jgi:hypothetical protein